VPDELGGLRVQREGLLLLLDLEEELHKGHVVRERTQPASALLP
jgi:hypothetical protein